MTYHLQLIFHFDASLFFRLVFGENIVMLQERKHTLLYEILNFAWEKQLFSNKSNLFPSVGNVNR